MDCKIHFEKHNRPVAKLFVQTLLHCTMDVEQVLLHMLFIVRWKSLLKRTFQGLAPRSQRLVVSCSRYWSTPLPIWVSDDFEEMVRVGSVAELEQLSGRKFVDIHRHHLDGVQIPSKLGKGTLRRIPEVFDCWFEGGSILFASKHHSFENKAEWETSFPAQFIGEALSGAHSIQVLWHD